LPILCRDEHIRFAKYGEGDKMTRDELKTWLATLDPMTDWRYDDLQVLEQQIVRVVKGSGYINIPFLLDKR